ncbi:CoA ester lyase [Rhodococcus sp. USK10]|nr:CoA ester lyase [Rhodococcus sp. USK10]QYB07096.1 CoA ester lyase [Rhodococcus sp. USK10]
MLTGPALLFCPADRPERYDKAAACADVVIVDLEDAVARSRKDEARSALVASSLDPARTVVRINGATTADHRRDLEALSQTAYRRVMLPKTETPDQVSRLIGHEVIALIESGAGMLALAEIAMAPNLAGLMIGSEDLIVSLGGRSSRQDDGTNRGVVNVARSQVLFAASAAGVPAIDSVYVDIRDSEGLRAESEDAAASGFAGKACIHPRQVEQVRLGFRPSPEDLEWARRVLLAAVSETGAFQFDGALVDEPVLRQAELILARVPQGE